MGAPGHLVMLGWVQSMRAPDRLPPECVAQMLLKSVRARVLLCSVCLRMALSTRGAGAQTVRHTLPLLLAAARSADSCQPAA